MDDIQIRWEPAGDGIRILQVYSELTSITIPDLIEGHPVTEIGPYCFSASEPASAEKIPGITNPPLSGRHVVRIRLPHGIRVLHNAAFYNCRSLESLSVGPCIQAIGSDEFTNCRKLTRLIYRGNEKECQGLSLILQRIESDLEVSIADRSVLFFPEYYEWLDEISPAHLFSRSINGEGFRMRKAIIDGTLDYNKYDSCFENALKTESDRVICRIAINRLCWPAGLTDLSRLLYQGALKDHFHTALIMAMETRDLELLRFLFDTFTPEASIYTDAIRIGTGKDWGEGTAWLMESQHKNNNFTKKRYEF